LIIAILKKVLSTLARSRKLTLSCSLTRDHYLLHRSHFRLSTPVLLSQRRLVQYGWRRQRIDAEVERLPWASLRESEWAGRGRWDATKI